MLKSIADAQKTICRKRGSTSCMTGIISWQALKRVAQRWHNISVVDFVVACTEIAESTTAYWHCFIQAQLSDRCDTGFS